MISNVEDTYHFNEIMTLLHQHSSTVQKPLVSREKWEVIQKTPFTVLISCLLSLRTKDEVTEDASIRLLGRYDTAEKIVALSEEEIQELIYPVGFYKTKAKRIKEISQTIIDVYNGTVPKDFTKLLSLKGVGRKTANIVMVYGFDDPSHIPIDTHCHRIPNRIGWIHTKTPEETELQLLRILPKQYWTDFNHLFVQFGQTICTPLSPHCSICPISQYCKKTQVTKHR
ncbi:MAG: endonuclease III [Candidatus Thermoplasmatota archaeon]|nr:endonuclease III [Candidatus Thermoplasmatota archaeon]